MTDADAVDAMLERIDEKLPPLGGVIHSVGVLSDAALTNQTWESFEHVLWPKIVGAWHLHRATMGQDLDLFILFSSRVGVMGNPGQANHAAANAFLDQLAGHRRALGLPGQAIAWGAWSEIGEAAEQRERIERRRAALGGRWFTPQQGIRALERLVRQDATTSVVMSMDWSVFEEAVEERPPLLEDMMSSAVDDESEDSASSEDLLTRLRGASVAEREQMLVSFLQGEIQAVMRLPSTPAPSVEFSDLGMDSLMAVELRNRMNRAFAGEYVASNTVVFDYPSITGLAGHLARDLGEISGATETVEAVEAAPVPEPPTERQERVQTTEDGIAIVGMSCRFPGAEGLSSFWRQMEEEENAVTDGRRDAGDWNGVAGDPDAEDATYRRGAFIEGIDRFDSRFFRISPIEARSMDPGQRLLLETTWQALEDAGIDPARLKGSRTGVYAGVGDSEYRHLLEASGGDSYLGTAGSVTVGRVAFTLGLEGPAVPMDLACAASLVAVHQAVAGLQRGEVDMALAGGVNAVLSTSVMRFLADAGMLSRSGQCWAFDAAADGYVRGEGCGVVVLKRLSDAEADGDRIWGVIRGSAVNQNGVGLGLTQPNGPAQVRVMEEALAQAGVAPAEVDYVEAHGPGTELGDAIELNALATVYGKDREPGRPLLVGSVKTNIGHLEAAGGIASLIKTVLAMSRGVIPRHLNFRNPHPEIDWERLPLRVTSEATDWPATPGRTPVAGVNVFGISGANAHLVVEGYEVDSRDSDGTYASPWPSGAPLGVATSDGGSQGLEGAARRTTRVLPLSGKTGKATRELAGRYLSWLDEHSEEADSSDSDLETLLSDMAWTAGVGRSHFDHRAGVVFSDIASLRDGLEAAIEAAEEDREPTPVGKVAFVYTGLLNRWAEMGKELYETEPVARAILDRCDALIREDRGASLLDVMFEDLGAGESIDDPAWTQPAVYALECALTALWSRVGIRPDVAVGHGLGRTAAAQAAGVLTLEDGLRLAATQGDFEEILSAVDVPAPSVTLVSGPNGQAVQAGERVDESYWRKQAGEREDLRGCAETLTDLGVDVVVGIGTEVVGRVVGTPRSVSPDGPVAVEGLYGPSTDGLESQPDGGFVKAVGTAYEEGLAVSFEGLFAGEARRRVSLPTYPFQRRRHWI